MPHCGGANSCNCIVTGDGVSGSGTLSDPYVITSAPEGDGGEPSTAHASTHASGGSDALAVTSLGVGSLADGQMLVRSGSALVGQAVPSGGGGGFGSVVFDNNPAKPAEGIGITYLVTSAVVWPSGVIWSTEPDNNTAPTVTGNAIAYLVTVGNSTYGVLGATFPATAVTFPDSTPPTAGTLTVGTVTAHTIAMSVSGASDAMGLHTSPYAFSTDDGTTWSAWQAAASYTASGLAAATTFQAKHRVRDAAGNITVGTAMSATTLVAPQLAAVKTDGMAASDVWPGLAYTWTGAAIGAASADRRVVVTVHSYLNMNPTATVTGMTIGGVTASRDAYKVRDNVVLVEVWSAVVPTGTTADVAVSFSGNDSPQYVRLSTHAITGAPSVFANAGAGDSGAAVTGIIEGVVVAASSVYNNGTQSTTAWSGGATQTWLGNGGDKIHGSVATTTASGAMTVAPNWDGGTGSAVVAAAYKTA